MRIPRDVSGGRLADVLCRKWAYARVHQVGSHIILETEEPTRTIGSQFQIITRSDSERSVQSSVLSHSTRLFSETR
jgi:hypothetical protein